ncbi:MAG: hypothetical protein QM775_10630 [Pirellulales bacterium]
MAVESAEHELEVSRQTLALKQAEVQVARETLARRRMTAPTSGVVTQLHRRSGEWVKPGDVVMRLMRSRSAADRRLRFRGDGGPP